MASVTTFIRNTPVAALRAYFDHRGISLPRAVDWGAPESEVVGPLLRAVDEMDDAARLRVVNDAERVSSMADEGGQVALQSVAQNPEFLDGLRNGHDRALWMFINDPEGFRHAEEVRFTDERRRGRMWDGFVGPANLPIRRDAQYLDAFKDAIRQSFHSNNVHVDIFDRTRPGAEGNDYALVQATVYREGLPDDFLEFVEGRLDRRARRPVYEAALTYELATGVIEAVANDRESREDLVRLFARSLLGAEFNQERLPLRRYDLSILLRPFDFPTDPADGIKSARVNSLRLMPLGTAGERVTLECMRGSDRTIWDMARTHFGTSDPLAGGWAVTQTRLTIYFHPDGESRRGRTLPLTITMPHGCNLKDCTERERLIGEKYLRRWGIVRDA